MEIRIRAAAIAAACLALIGSAAACSSSGGASEGNGTTPANSSSDETTSPAGTTPASSDSPTSAPTAADKSKAPVEVGFQTALNGAVALPDVKKGFDAGVAYVNAEQGGINGSPLKAVTCGTDGTPDAAVNCGNTFVQDKVVLATLGFDFAADAVLPVLKGAGIGLFGYQAVTPGADSAVGQAYFGSPSLEESFSAAVVVQHDLGSKSLAVLAPDVPSMHDGYTKQIQPAADKLGVSVKSYFYPTTTDWASFASTVVSTNPGGIVVYAADSDSLAAIPALRNAGFTGVIDASTSTTIVDKLPADTLKNVLFVTPFLSNIYEQSALSDKVKGDIAVFEKYTKPTSSTIISYAQFGFYTAVQAADMLRQVSTKVGGKLTAQNVLSNLANTTGPEFFRDSTYDCSKPSWPGTTSCSSGFNYAEVTGGKKLEPLKNSPIDVSSVKPSS